ncbi:MAG: DUF927 domain-containing protein [Clostridia bacterium]|nr:DUF927 domain-containing protein [Clostridia bacterium]
MYNNANIMNGRYGYDKFDDDGNWTGFTPKGKAITLDEIRTSIENGDTMWRVSFDYLGGIRRYDFPREFILDKKHVAELTRKGADITTKTFNCFVDSMRQQEDQTTSYRNVFENLGWIKLPINGQLEYAFRCSKLLGSKSAEYTGNISLKTNGTVDGWAAMVKEEVLGRPQLETILLAALSAPIVGIHGVNSTTDNPIYHINFRSGRGKSTALCLAAATAGEPFEGTRNEYDAYGVPQQKASVLGSWGATPKATITAHSGNRGIPVILNELGKFAGTDMTAIVFNLSEGSDIKRLNTQLETLVSEGFNTTFISCGEMSLVGRCKSKLEGIKCRVMEMAVQMTDDADHSRRIKEACSQNYGFAVPIMAKYIREKGGYEMVQALYGEVLRELTASAPEGVADRFIEKFPTFLVMAARIAKQALGLEFDEDAVVNFCYECAMQGKEDEGEVCRSFEEIIGCFEEHIDNFFDDSRKDHIPRMAWGRVNRLNIVKNGRVLVKQFCIYPEVLTRVLKEELKYPNPSTEIKLWRDKDALSHEAKHLTKKVKINPQDKPQRAYVLNLWEAAPVKTSSKSQLPQLLAEDEADEEIEQEEVQDNELLDS